MGNHDIGYIHKLEESMCYNDDGTIKNDFYWEEHYLYWSPYLTTYDYDQLKSSRSDLHHELIQKVYHPQRVFRYLNMGYALDDM